MNDRRRQLAELMSLEGRVALVTGAAGHIGQALTEALVEAGAAVAIADREAERCATAARALRESGARTEPFAVDVTDEAAVRELPGAVANRLGRLDVLVNNAAFVGTASLRGWAVPFPDQLADTWRRALEVNLTAPFVLSQASAPMLRESGHGVIVNVASIYGSVGHQPSVYAGTGLGTPAAYAASKGGLLQLTRWLAAELAPDVRVNALVPGGVLRGQPMDFRRRYEERCPLGRMATEEDLKGAIAYLASDLSAYVTGHGLVVDGGWTAW